jgi:glycogen debranching enzyme
MKNTNKRRILDFDITPITLAKFKSQGLIPYYYDSDTNIVEITSPIKGKTYNTIPKEVFLLTPDEFNKIKKLSDNIKEIIELKMSTIKLYKQYIPASLNKLIE